MGCLGDRRLGSFGRGIPPSSKPDPSDPKRFLDLDTVPSLPTTLAVASDLPFPPLLLPSTSGTSDADRSAEGPDTSDAPDAVEIGTVPRRRRHRSNAAETAVGRSRSPDNRTDLQVRRRRYRADRVSEIEADLGQVAYEVKRSDTPADPDADADEADAVRSAVDEQATVGEVEA